MQGNRVLFYGGIPALFASLREHNQPLPGLT
jgi:hypothetical protein